MHPSIFRPDTTFKHFCPIFPANGQILHPSIETSHKGTVVCLKSQFFVFVYSFSFEKNWLILVFLASSLQVQLSKKTLLRYKVTYAQLKKYSHDKNSAIKKVGELAEKKGGVFFPQVIHIV